MSTPKQIEANRRNAQKSTGPRTPEGKAASKMNALKSGIDAQALFIRFEKPADLEALVADYYQRFQPATPEERCFVDILIRDEWQLRRLSAIEAELWEHQLTLLRDDEPYPRGHAFQLTDATFARLQRRIDQTERSYKIALHELERLQLSRETQAPEPSPILQPVANKPETPQIGFVPQPAEVGRTPWSAASPLAGPPPPLRTNPNVDAPSPNPYEALSKLPASAPRR
jgi:hypothetical protein